MNAFGTWLASTPLGSAFKVLLSGVLGFALISWTSDGKFSLDKWQDWLIGALAIALPPVINWLNPADARYGRGSDANQS